MRCFNHHDQPAIGTCKHCCKGLCASCATDLGYGLACRDAHEKQVESTHTMFNKAVRLQSVNRSNKYLSPTLCSVLGAVFIGYGVVARDAATSFTVVLGSVFLLYGLFLFNVVRKAYAQPKT